MKVRGPDELFHTFFQTTGGWEHFTQAPGETGWTPADRGHVFTFQEMRDTLEELQGFGPITDDEIKWIKLHAKQGQVHDGVDWSQETNEIEADPQRVKTEPQFQCLACTMWFPITSKRRFSWDAFPAGKGYCPPCHNRRIREMGYHSGGYG